MGIPTLDDFDKDVEDVEVAMLALRAIALLKALEAPPLELECEDSQARTAERTFDDVAAAEAEAVAVQRYFEAKLESHKRAAVLTPVEALQKKLMDEYEMATLAHEAGDADGAAEFRSNAQVLRAKLAAARLAAADVADHERERARKAQEQAAQEQAARQDCTTSRVSTSEGGPPRRPLF